MIPISNRKPTHKEGTKGPPSQCKSKDVDLPCRKRCQGNVHVSTLMLDGGKKKNSPGNLSL